MTKKVLVPIDDGSEEIEAVCIIDILRRAGTAVTVASCKADKGLQVTASRGVKIVADCHISQCLGQSFDLIALPGGMPGAEHLRDNQTLSDLLKTQLREEKWLAAICASPAIVFEQHGLINDTRATCHPAFHQQLKRLDAESRVVIDGHCITSQGPGTAIEFALALVEVLFGADKHRELAQAMVV